MKRLFTFAIVALMATLAFAQSQQVQRRVAYTSVQRAMHVGLLGPKAQAEKALKAEAANELGRTRLVRATNPAAGYQQLSLNDNVLSTAKVGRTIDNAPYKAPAKVTETDGNLTITKDANGIITGVEGGTTKYYDRTAGYAYSYTGSGVSAAYQSGTVTMVEDGNTVYMLNPLSSVSGTVWVKGTKNGSAITFATKQPLMYNTNYATTLSMRWGKWTKGQSATNDDEHADVFTFAIDGNTLKLQGTMFLNNAENEGDDTFFAGLFRDDDDSWQGYGDCETVLTANDDYVPASTDPVVLPAGLTTESWYLNGSSYDGDTDTPVMNQNVKVAFDGNDVYVQGIFEDFPTSWVKGTKNGNTYKFDAFQYLGVYGTYNIWMVGVDDDGMTDAIATYDATAKNITFTTSILANASDAKVYFLTWLDDVVLSADEVQYVEPVLNEKTATLPYLNTFDTADEQGEVAIYDANKDGSTFSFEKITSNSDDIAARYRYSTSNTGNDYLVFPAVQLEAGKSYHISMDVRSYSDRYPERMTVLCGKESKVSALTTVVIEPTDVATSEYFAVSNSDFKVAETGMYTFAVKAISDPDQFYLWVDNFSIKANNLNAPVAPADVVVTPDANGANNATITFTAPTKNLAGNNISGVLDMVIKVDGVEAVSKKVTTGTAVSEEVTVDAPGIHKFTVEFSCAAGVADPVTVSAYIGIDLPTEPDNFELQDKNTTVAMSWTAPEVGVNGGAFYPDQLVYNIYPVEMVEFWGMVYPSIDYDNPYATGISGTSYDLAFDTNDGEQGYTFFGIAAENEAGEGDGVYSAMLTGKPYSLPVKESLAGGSLSYWWGSDCDENNYYLEGGVYAGENASDEDGFCLEFQGMTQGWAFLKSGKIALAGAANPVYQFDAVKTLGTATLDVYVVTPEGTTKVQTIEPTDEYVTYTVSLVDYKDAAWVSVILQANFEGYATASGDPVAIVDVDNIKVVNLLDHNLSVVSLTAHGKVNAGADVVATLTVQNNGKDAVAAADYTVNFYVNGEEHAVEGVDIAAGEKAEFTYTMATSAASAESYTFTAEVVYAADEDKADNTAGDVKVVVAQANYPTAANVAANLENTTVTLAWGEPDLENVTPDPVTEDFEAYEPFQFGEAIGDWTLVDGDGTAMGGMQNTDVPNLTVGETTGSFFVLNRESVSSHESFDPANGGVQYLSTMFAYNADNGSKLDDWLISPALPGVAQTISFFAKSYSGDYKETMQVLYSTTDMATSSFKKLTGMVDVTVPDAWTEFSYNLPEGAKYFAIRCTSDDKFMLFVDDITYIPANGAKADLEIVGYNVYRDGVKLNAEPVAETTYVDGNLEEGTTYVYAVSVVYTQGESKAVAADAVTGIESIDAENGNATYYNMQGVQVAKPATGTTCIRVINGKATKVIIR